MNRHPWPFGTRKRVRVWHQTSYYRQGKKCFVLYVQEVGTAQGLTLAGKHWPGAQVGDTGTIVFTASFHSEGVATGGVWKLEEPNHAKQNPT